MTKINLKSFKLLRLKKLSSSDRALAVGLGALFLVFIVSHLWSSPPAQAQSEKRFEFGSAIPDGFVLVPINIENQEAIESLIGDFANVNVYAWKDVSGVHKKTMIGKGLKLFRSPMNPSQFGLLVQDEEAGSFTNPEQKYSVVIRNTNSKVPRNRPTKATRYFSFSQGQNSLNSAAKLSGDKTGDNTGDKK